MNLEVESAGALVTAVLAVREIDGDSASRSNVAAFAAADEASAMTGTIVNLSMGAWTTEPRNPQGRTSIQQRTSMQLTNRTILITGGSAGIGLAFALKFVELGNEVIVTGRR